MMISERLKDFNLVPSRTFRRGGITLYQLFAEVSKKQKIKGFIKECPGCTCGYELDVTLNLRRHKISKRT